PPQDVAAEQSVLGAMLLSKDAIADVVEQVREHDFYRPNHQTIFSTVIDLYSRGEPADAVTVAAELTRSGELAKIGGAAYLHTLVASVPTAANAGYYARIVKEKAILRRLVEAGTRIVQMSYDETGEVDNLVDRAQAEIYDVTDRRTADDYQKLDKLMNDALEEMNAIAQHGDKLVGIPTGFNDLDKLLNGLQPGQLIMLAARPGMGKSTLGLDFARAASIKNNATSAVFSLEMGKNEIVMRLLSAESAGLTAMRSGKMNETDWQKLARKMSGVSNAPLFIDDSPNLTITEIRAKCRRLKQRHDLKLIIVDYLQLMTSGRKVESRQQEVSEFSRSLKLLAKELDVPVVVLADLRESGSLEQDSDVVILIHRDDHYNRESERQGEADLIVAKHRNGPTGVINVSFQGHYSRFAEMPQSFNNASSNVN
ncbi:MAG: replicative helicase, partial [Actinomycetota bacterium]